MWQYRLAGMWRPQRPANDGLQLNGSQRKYDWRHLQLSHRRIINVMQRGQLTALNRPSTCL